MLFRCDIISRRVMYQSVGQSVTGFKIRDRLFLRMEDLEIDLYMLFGILSNILTT